MKLDDFYHVGIIVEDFDSAVANYGRLWNLEWTPIINVDVTLWTRDYGVRQVRPRAVYSVLHPHIEVVEAILQTILTVTPGRPVHHLGYWSDDLEGDSNALIAQGWPKVMCAYDNGRMFGMAYHQRPDGMIVEIVDRASFPDWQGFLAGKMEHEVILPD